MKIARSIGAILLGGVFLTGCTNFVGAAESNLIPVKDLSHEKLLAVSERTLPAVKMTTNDKLLAEMNTLRSKLVISQGSSLHKQVAFTFDDGPDTHFTNQVLDILKKEKVPATFFVCGNNVKAHPDVVKRIDEEGHSVGNHSWNHPQLTKKDQATINQQITSTNDAIKSAIGKTPTLFRPPYGAFNLGVRDKVQQLNMKVILWSVDTLDWNHKSKDQIMEAYHKEFKPGGIILQHSSGNEGLKETVKALPEMIRDLKSKGYSFVTVDKLIGVEAYQ
ncbi:polysaccharide deacetylase family sporulation protein PdaB [Thermoactinomyces sp. DSM 45891]|uniref:polysaccharide deacetylase family protein n=1 Tax=Thermoactinomyces sp. DSM 45891 TaxID=1761907 RepID=UPI00091FE9EC|nr:polysaccharide deacetylase family protein [Thermoactinomyces sp. DSM 45891]SFX08792.1 polysaccharide deacetylase family sporulation protein PdaB [Thermoactinomyces sp. DSM 45891]